FCALPRLAYLWIDPPVIGNLPDYYWALSSSLLEGKGLLLDSNKTALIEPGYPLFLAFVRWLTHDHLLLTMTLQILVSVVGCWTLFQLTWLLSKNRRAASIAAILYSLYPYWI